MNRRWGFAAAVFISVGFATGVAFAVHASRGSGVPRPLGARVRVGQLDLQLPRGFNSYALPIYMGPGAGLASHVITNFRPPGHKTIEWVLNRWKSAREKFMLVKKHDYGPASDEVALQLTQSPERFCRFTCPPIRLLHLPLSADQPWDEERLASGATGYRSGSFWFHHDFYSVMYWIGPNAPANDQAAVLAALHSIGPASQ